MRTSPAPSKVRTARFAQPIGAATLYPMLAPCGLFVPSLPLTYAISLIQGIWQGEAWSAHMGDVAALVVVFAVCTAQPTLGGSRTVGKWYASLERGQRESCDALRVFHEAPDLI
jgi:hypothetical protein